MASSEKSRFIHTLQRALENATQHIAYVYVEPV